MSENKKRGPTDNVMPDRPTVVVCEREDMEVVRRQVTAVIGDQASLDACLAVANEEIGPLMLRLQKAFDAARPSEGATHQELAFVFSLMSANAEQAAARDIIEQREQKCPCKDCAVLRSLRPFVSEQVRSDARRHAVTMAVARMHTLSDVFRGLARLLCCNALDPVDLTKDGGAERAVETMINARGSEGPSS